MCIATIVFLWWVLDPLASVINIRDITVLLEESKQTCYADLTPSSASLCWKSCVCFKIDYIEHCVLESVVDSFENGWVRFATSGHHYFWNEKIYLQTPWTLFDDLLFTSFGWCGEGGRGIAFASRPAVASCETPVITVILFCNCFDIFYTGKYSAALWNFQYIMMLQLHLLVAQWENFMVVC